MKSFIALLLAVGGSLSGQIANTTALVGTVSDSSGRVIVGAKITARNVGTDDTYASATNQDGYYRIDFVRVGTYNVSAENSGFAKIERTGSVVDANQVVRNDFTLTPGTVNQQITIEAAAAVIKTDSATISESISAKQLADLPMNGRDPMMLATTTPGVLPGTKGTTGVPPGEDFIGAGTREIQNSISLDGISIMNNLITTTPTRPMVETVQEVEVQTGTYSAQYGAYMGVHINVVSKAGTNQIHGNLVEFIRNDAFDARPFFLNPALKKTALRQNQYGFEFDGPVVLPKLYNGRDKTFFMGSFEGLRTKRQSASTSTVMPPEFFAGDFSAALLLATPVIVKDPDTGIAFPGNIVPANRISPITTALRKYYVNPNVAGLTQNLLTVVPNNTDMDQTVDRADQNIGSKVRLFFRYQRQHGKYASGSAIPYNAATTPLTTDNYTGGYTHTLSSRLVNDFRFGRQWFSSDSVNYFYLNGIQDAGASLGIPGFDADVKTKNPGTPEFNVNGFSGWGNSGTNWFQTDKTWQASEQLSWMKGNHSIMFGAELRKLITGRTAANSPRGVFNFTTQFTGYGPSDFMLGLPNTLTTPANELPGEVAGWRNGFFALDNWQVSRKLTVNYGLRYELPTVPYSTTGYSTELNADQTAAVPANPPQPGFHFHYPNHKSWSPRVGFAYRVSEKTVVRGGFGIYYNPNQTNSFTFLTTNPPFGNATTCTSLPTTPTLSLNNPTGSGCTTVSPNWITDNWHLPPASMNQWSLGIQRQLSKTTVLDIQYLGSHSLHLDRSYFNNTPYLPGAGAVGPRRPNQLFGQIRTITNDEIANYEALSISVHQRFWHGMQFDGSYTWSHTLDVTSDSNNGGAPMNPYNWRQDYGNAPFDIRHRFVGTYIAEVPFFRTEHHWLETAFGKWQFNGISTMQSGAPYNITIATDTANTSGQGSYRPNLVHAPTANCGGGHLTACIDATAFAVPALYSYGNAGRNLLHGPHLFTTDLSLHKAFPIRERLRFTFRFEAFNVFNNPEFSNPSTNFSSLPTFGNITSTSIGSRAVQLGGKVSF